MNSGLLAPAFFIGWDVGGWNCDKHSKSSDAIVILDANLAIVGEPWRDNLRPFINAAETGSDWIQSLFALCKATPPPNDSQFTLAIDAPLGFSQAFVSLITGLEHVDAVESHDKNPYLFRQTERRLFEKGFRPLSAVKDMIGSQTTKGMHALAKFAPKVDRCGVWTDGHALTAIEAYPSPCKNSALMNALLEPYADWRQANHQDKSDALTCALIAYCFAARPQTLSQPGDGVPACEGWIWLPKDVLPVVRHDSEKLVKG